MALLDPNGSLLDCEIALMAQLPKITLLCELPRDPQDRELILRNLREVLAGFQLSDASKVLQDLFPASLAVFLVLEGIFGFREGDYWSSVCERVNVKRNPYAQEWGKAFERFLQQHGLPHFNELGGNRYVTKILAHGGIPDYCLRDFYGILLQPAVERPELCSLSPAELVEEWRVHDSKLVSVDKPAWRFLLYGGRVALDFLGRCLDMARFAAGGEVLPSAVVLGLPARVVTQYDEWLRESPVAPRAQLPHYPRFRRPILSLDPWGEGIRLTLLAQQLEPDLSTEDVAWSVTAGNTSAIFPAHARRQRGYVETEEQCVPIEFPAERFGVAVLVQGRSVREWIFDGPSRDRPVLAFSSEDLRVISQGDPLPSGKVWLGTPRHYAPVGVAHGQAGSESPLAPLVEVQAPGLGWAEYRFCLVDLRGLSCVRLRSAVFPEASIPIAPPAPPEPTLVGGTPAGRMLSSPAGAPIYSHTPPRLEIPLDHPDDPSLDLPRWFISIHAIGGAEPERHVHISLAALREWVSYDGGGSAFQVPLDAPGLLGPDAIGEFTVVARGPLGRDARWRLVILPTVSITPDTPLWIPSNTEKGPGPSIRITLPKSSRPALSEQDGMVTALSDPGQKATDVHTFRVTLPGSATIPGSIMVSVSSGRTLEIAVRFQAPCVQWALLGLEDKPAPIEWCANAIRVSREILDQAPRPELVTRIFIETGTVEHVRLQLQAGTDTRQEAPATVGKGYFRFDLRPFREAIKSSAEAMIQFALLLQVQDPTRGTWTPVAAPAVQVTAHFVADKIRLEEQEAKEPDSRIITLHWEESLPLRGRAALFWSLSRPWSTPVRVDIPDSAAGAHTFAVPKHQFLPGRYRLELKLIDPWGSLSRGGRPKRGAAGAVDVWVGKQDWLPYLWNLPPGALRCLERFLAAYYEDRTKAPWGLLADLPKELREEEIPSLLWMLQAFSGEEIENDSALVTLRERYAAPLLLSDRAHLFLKSLAGIVGELPALELEAVRGLLVGLGVPQRVKGFGASKGTTGRQPPDLAVEHLERLWEAWPPLGVFLESSTRPARAGSVCGRCERYLGRNALGRLAPWRVGSRVLLGLKKSPLLPDRTFQWATTVVKCHEAHVPGVANFGPTLGIGIEVDLQGKDPKEQPVLVRIERQEHGDHVAIVVSGEEEETFLSWASRELGWPAADVASPLLRPSVSTKSAPHEMFGAAAEPPFVDGSKGVADLESLRAELIKTHGYFREGVLGGDAFHLANLSWALAVSRSVQLRQAAQSWVDTEVDRVREYLEVLVKQGFMKPWLQEAIEQRWSPHRHSCPLVCLPYLVLGTATVQRFLAFDMLPAQLTLGQKEYWLKLGTQAFRLARELYEYDLCLMELVLRWYHPTSHQ